MKKFLFTLAALLMVGTVCAENYWYIDDFQVTQAQLGTNNQRINVKAHYDQYVSAIQATFTMPEGLQIRTYRAGSDLTMSGYDDLGDPITSTPDLQFLPDHIENFIVASMASCYDQDGNLLGAFHWAPGDYAQMLQIVLIIDENFAGGEITVKTEPSSSGWADGSQDCPKNEEWTRTCTVTVEGAEPPTPQPSDCEAPVIDWSIQPGAVVVTVTPDENTDGTLVYDGQYSYERGTEEYTVHVTAYTTATENYNQSPLAEQDITIPALETARTPEITYTYDTEEGTITVWAYGSQDGNSYTLIGPDGTEYENNYTFEYNIYEGYDKVWKAYATGTYMQQSATAEKEVIVEAVQYETPKPTVVIADEANPTTITVTGEGTLTLYVAGEAVATGTGTLEYTIDWLPYGNDEQFLSVYATALNTEYQDALPGVSASQTAYVGVLDPVWQSVDAPVISYETTDDEVIVTITWPETTGQHVYTGEYSYPRGEEDASFDVEAYTEADYPYAESTHATETIPVPKKEQVTPPVGETTTFVKVTSTDQLVAGKKYIIVYDNLAMGAIENNAGTPVAVTVNGDEVEAGEDVMVFTLGGTQYLFTLAVGDQYLRPNGASNTGISLGASADWKPAAANGGIGVLSDLSDGSRGILYRTSENCFRHYAKSNVGNGYDYGLLYVEKIDEPVLEDLAGEIVFSAVDQENGAYTVTYEGPEEGVTVEVINVEQVRGEYFLPDYGTYAVTAKATKEGYNPLEKTENLTWNEPVQPAQTEKPTLSYEEVDGGYLVTAVGDGTVTIYVEDIQVAQEEGTATYFIPYNPEGEEYGVSATAQAPDELVSEPAVITVEDPGQTAKPTITYTDDPDNHVVHVTATGDGTVTLYVEDVQVAQGDGSATWDLPYTEDEYGEEVGVSATAQDEGQRVSEPATATIEVPGTEPVTPPVQVGAPIFEGYTQDGVTGYGVTITPTTEGSSIKYRVFVWVPNEEGDTEHVGDLEYGHWDLIQDWTDYQGVDQEIWKTEVDASYRVEAYAYIGDVQSNTVATEFTVEKTPETGINEMVNGKSIANVRYFNMAGQEMQEANGVTIVVTTYTDGTTSAVKVMK